MITGSNLTFAYKKAAVVDNVSITAASGEIVGLVGPNGCGKSTLLKLLYGSLVPKSGEVSLDGENLAGLARKQIAQKISVVVQEAPTEVPFTVLNLVLLGRVPHLNSFESYTASDLAAAKQSISKVGLSDYGQRYFSELSGGEKQRVLIARALVQDTENLVLDEPTNHLDIRYQHEILRLVNGLGKTTIIVLHDLNLAARYCDKIVLLNKARVVATGTPSEVLTPANLEAVYGVTAERIEVKGVPQLLFSL